MTPRPSSLTNDQGAVAIRFYRPPAHRADGPLPVARLLAIGWNHECPDLVAEGPGVDRLGDVSAATGGERQLPVAGHRMGRQRHDGDGDCCRIRFELASETKASLSRHLTV